MKLRYEEPLIPRLVPRPSWCGGIEEPVMVLDGSWKLKHSEEPEQFLFEKDFNNWPDIPVPSDMGVHKNEGSPFTGNYIYKRQVKLPEVTENVSYVLRFEGVNGFAKVYIDGEYAADHENGFVSWNTDITEYLKEKKEFTLTVSVDETRDQVSTFNHGGILHSVLLFRLPCNYFTMVRTTTVFDETYRDCTLQLQLGLKENNSESRYEAELADPHGITVFRGKLQSLQISEDGIHSAEISVKTPMKWDAEHPWLYTLKLSLWTGEEKSEEIIHRFGFRQIKRVENRLYVNGQEVKLRGVCRHEISPLNGRCLTKELIEQDVALFKEANCNYIRTSHYPPSEYFLDQCDEKGIYVEDELALAFIARTLKYTQRDPALTKRYLSHFAEVFARDFSHPSVLIWSLCNESFGGYNFDLLNRFAHRLDPTRPTKFSYPMTMQEEHEPVDIWSIHYSNLEEDLAKKCDNVSVGYSPGYDLPVLHDEYAHIPCYNRTEHRRDPNVRNFWGESIKRFWDKIWVTKGALGGAIWAGIDETNIFNGGATCLEWGIIDIWRRKKPEHYLTRKAYSPIVIKNEEFLCSDNRITVEMENRFCHTNLKEVGMEWKYGEVTGTLMGPDVLPGERGRIEINLSAGTVSAPSGTGDFCSGAKLPDLIALNFADAFENRVDEYLLPVIKEGTGLGKASEERTGKGSLTCKEEETVFSVAGESFHMAFSRKTGLLTEALAGGKPVLTGGPCLNVPYLRLGPWKCTGFKTERENDKILVTIKGAYGNDLDVTFLILVGPDGTFETHYTIDHLYAKLPKEIKLRVGVDCGGLDELGIYYTAHPSLDTLSWKRKGLWSVYPKDHIARCAGTAKRKSRGSIFGKKPEIPWSLEMKSYILNGKYDVDYKGTNDFRSLKEHIYVASLKGKDAGIEAVSDGSHSLRLEIADPEERIISDRDRRIRYHGTWYPMEDYAGSLNQTEMWSREEGAFAECTFTGTGIVWYGPVDTIYGIAKVYVDGKLMDAAVNQRVNGVDFPGSAAGYDKKYGYPLYSIKGLANGEHFIRIEVTGAKAPDAKNSYIVIDYLRVIAEEMEEPIRFIVNNEYNYPHIAWGNYTKPPVRIYDGYRNSVRMRLFGKEGGDGRKGN